MTSSAPPPPAPGSAPTGAVDGADTGDTAGAVHGTAGGERDRAHAVAGVVLGLARRRGLDLDPGLAIWRLAGLDPDGPDADPPEHRGPSSPGSATVDGEVAGAVGAALERATDGARRRARGLHVTPPWLARRLVGLALPPGPTSSAAADPAVRPTVCDPACGGGAFLLAAAERLHEGGVPRRAVVRDLIWGADVDAVGLAAAEAALALWAGERPPPGRLVLADPLTDAAPWPEGPAPGFDVVVGNPPFQSQLGRATARTAEERGRLRARFGPAVRAYTDTAWLFLLLGCELVRPGGRVVLVEPQSLVAARDAAAVRALVDDRAELLELWVDERRVFDASVRVCAPVLRRRSPDEPVPTAVPPAVDEPVPTAVPPAVEEPVPTAVPPAVDRWGRLWARAAGVPPVDLAGSVTLGDRAAVVAGFRDQYYGLVDVVRESAGVPAAAVPAAAVAAAAVAEPGAPGPTEPGAPGPAASEPGAPAPDAADETAPLVTSGAIDWAACTWGARPVRYAKRAWRAPVVDLVALEGAPAAARRWVERTRRPKLVVATQTRVVEAAVDAGGTWVPSVPALAVVPHDPADLWPLAAAVLSPAATVWLQWRSGGTGLDRGALKVSGPDLAALPLPVDEGAWDEAARWLRLVGGSPGGSDGASEGATADGVAHEEYLAAIAAAYGTPPPLTAWWRARAGTVVHARGAGR